MAASRNGLIRAAVSGAMLTLVAGMFWTRSRWPALDRKLVMGAGGRAEVRGLGFDAIVPVQGETWERIGAVFLNWCWSNRYGMAFGLVFAALLVTFLSSLPAVRPRSRLLGAALGTLIGAPLSVCANCVAPIGQGLAQRGERAETVLATMVASPTLNPAALGLLFTLFPSSVWGPRMVGLGLLLLGVVPWIAGTARMPPPPPDLLALDGPPVVDVLRDTLRAFVWLVRTTVPWMLLAGLLGAAVIVLLPPDLLVGVDGLPAIAAASLLGTFLPVPITFDIVLTATLVAAGLGVGPAAALVATLGTWSVYSAAIARQTLGGGLSARMTLAVAVIGFGAGVVAEQLDSSRQEAALASMPASRADRLEPHLAAVCDRHPDPGICRGRVGGFFAMKERDVDLCALAGTDFGSARCALDIATMPRRPLPPTVEELHALCVRLAPDSPDGCVVDAVVTSRRSDLCARTATPGACRNDMDEALAADEGRCIGAPADIVACEQEATARFAAGSRNPALCDGLPEPRRTSCAVEVWARAGRETADPYPCAQIAQLGDAESADACRRFQALAPAIRSGDPERCLATEDAAACMSWQLQDPRSIAEHVLARAAGDPSSTSGEPPWGHLSVTARPPLDEAPAWQAVATPPGFVAQRRPLAAASPGAPRFERESGRALGLVLDGLDGTQLHEPFAFGRGVASADVDGDGDVDLAFGARGGPAIFHAHKGRYVRVAIPEAARGLDVMGVRFADMDGDARPDLWVSAWGGIVGWIANDGGGIGDGPLHAIPATDRLLAMAVALGDVDEDGDLDAILGTWTSGAATGFDAEHSTDELWLADGPGWRRAVLDDVPGETLANLLTDTDGDGVLELYSANDGPGPDVAFRFEEGVAVPIRRGDPGALPRTSWFAMSLDSGDLDGDGRLDLVSADMSFPRASVPSVCDAVPEGDAGACRSLVATSRAVRDVDVAACEDDGCRVGAALQFALLHRRADLCAALPWPDVRDFCAARLALSAAPDRAPPSEAYVPQVERNLILARTQDGFVDRTADWGLGGTGWTWNLRLVDLDADGDLDLHAGNGYLLSGPFPGDAVADVAQRWDGTGFADATEAWGLGDVNHTTAFVFVDVDGDGDLDRVATSPVSGPTVHRNQGGAGHSLVVLADAGGRNRDGIGARVEIRVSGRAQVAEVRASGGFLSAEAPAARFGLGDATTVDSVRVRWPDGGEAVLGPVPGDSVLRVARGE